MNRSDVGHFLDVNGKAGTDVATIGGAIDLAAPIADEAEDGLFIETSVPDSADPDEVYYQPAWLAIDAGATGTLTDAVLYNRAGLKPNFSIGLAQIVSTSAEDTGVVTLTGKEDWDGTDWEQDAITVNGTTAVNGVVEWGTQGLIRAEHTINGVETKPIGNITVSVEGVIVCVIFGTGSPAVSDNGKGNWMCTAEYQIAAATAKNTEIGWSTANRRNAPDSNVGGFDYAVRFSASDDESLPLADDYVASDAINYCAMLTLYAGIPAAVGPLQLDVDLQGRAVSS